MPSGVWYYAVRSVDRNGNLSVPSNVVTVDVDYVPPPTGLTIFPLGEWLMLRWQPVTGAADYRVFRSNGLYGSVELSGNGHGYVLPHPDTIRTKLLLGDGGTINDFAPQERFGLALWPARFFVRFSDGCLWRGTTGNREIIISYKSEKLTPN